MDAAWVARARWRSRGAWLWPTFVGLTIADGIIGHALPPAGETQTLVAALILGCGLNLVTVVVLRAPVGALVRRVRPDLPKLIARDYAGMGMLGVVSAALLAIGLAHNSAVLAHRQALREATARAEAWIGARAPAEFRRDANSISTLTIEPGRTYRSCAVTPDARHSFCVIVKPQLPLVQSVRFDGYEPNWLFAQGMG